MKGFIAGAFDIIHPGYVQMFREAKHHCDFLVVGLHEDPESNGKLRPILSVDDRMNILQSIRYVDRVIPYRGESGLLELLEYEKPNIRFLGDDYKNKTYTGQDLAPIHFLDRSHNWSTTKLKHLIYKSVSKE